MMMEPDQTLRSPSLTPEQQQYLKEAALSEMTPERRDFMLGSWERSQGERRGPTGAEIKRLVAHLYASINLMPVPDAHAMVEYQGPENLASGTQRRAKPGATYIGSLTGVSNRRRPCMSLVRRRRTCRR